MDRRQQKTRAAVFSAFSSLLSRKKFTAITVQEIIDEANIGRSTFYAHFETKDDLLRELCRDIFDHVFSDSLEQEKGHDFSHTPYPIEEKITHILYHLQENRTSLNGILSCESSDLFLHFFKQYLREVFAPYVCQQNYKAPADYVMNHIVCDFAETVRWWITRAEQYSPQEVSAFFMETNPFGYGKQQSDRL